MMKLTSAQEERAPSPPCVSRIDPGLDGLLLVLGTLGFTEPTGDEKH